MKIFSILPAIMVPMLISACTQSINLPLDHAKIADGYINSSSLDFGHVLIWDTTTNNTSNINKVTKSVAMSSGADVDEGPKFKKKTSSVSRDSKFEISGNVSAQVKAQVEAQFISSTNITLDNYNPRQFRTPEYVLNCRGLRAWRQSINDEYASDRYRFVFISRVVDAANISISRNSSVTGGANADVIKVGSYKFSTSYDGKNQASIQSDGNSPLVVQPTVFKFRKTGNSLRFHPDLNTTFTFAK